MEVDYPRVTHPFAGLLALAGFLPRLACVRHAASVRSEPGSNSPIIFFWSVSSWADVLQYSLKALRCPQSASWTCYPIFKDRTDQPALRATDCGTAPSTTDHRQRNFPARLAAPSRCLPHEGARCVPTRRGGVKRGSDALEDPRIRSSVERLW